MKSSKSKRAPKARTSANAGVEPAFDRVLAAFAGDPEVTTGKMMASVGFKVGGKIFAMMSRGKFVAKLPKGRVDELVPSVLGAYFDPRRDGRLMKEWIALKGTEPSRVDLANEARRLVSGRGSVPRKRQRA